jgi:mannose-6-phosphate isomerase
VLSWELLDTPEGSSRIANGPLAGHTLGELVARAPAAVVGSRHPPGAPFPFCVCLRETTADQPLAVHPERELTVNDIRRGRNNKFWYVLDHGADARIFAGISHAATRMRILQRLDTRELDALLQAFDSHAYDAFFIPAGRVHCLGAANLVWELQERPTPPLRISAWSAAETIPEEEREAGLGAVYFQDRQLLRIRGDASPLAHTRRIPILPHCPIFRIEEIRLHDHLFDQTSSSGFHLVGQMSGKARITANRTTILLEQGEVALLPAALGDYRMYAEDGPARLLRVSPRM